MPKRIMHCSLYQLDLDFSYMPQYLTKGDLMIATFYTTQRKINTQPFIFKFREKDSKSWDIVRIVATSNATATKWFEKNFEDVAEFEINTVFLA